MNNKIKKWKVTRITSTTIEVKSETEPLQGADKWIFEERYNKKLEESYRDDGLVDWEVEEIE